jgi:hypothetical protein
MPTLLTVNSSTPLCPHVDRDTPSLWMGYNLTSTLLMVERVTLSHLHCWLW